MTGRARVNAKTIARKTVASLIRLRDVIVLVVVWELGFTVVRRQLVTKRDFGKNTATNLHPARTRRAIFGMMVVQQILADQGKFDVF